MPRYTPRKGDLVIMTFDPQAGHEQKGRRPALIVSNDLFNRHTGFAVTCPITSTDRGIPFHVKLPPDCSVSGFIMIDQVKSVDFRSRRATFVEAAPSELMLEVMGILKACLF